MADDDDVPDELWDMLDTLGHSKNPTMTQAPSAAFQQPAAHKPALVGQQNQHHGLPTWRPQHLQQLPLAPPSKPASLAQQLAGTSQFPRAPAISFQQSANHANGLPRYTQQQQQPWQPRQAWGTSQWSSNHLTSNQQATMQQPMQQQMPLVSPEPAVSAAAGAANSSNAGPFNHAAPAVNATASADAGTPAVQQVMQATQALTPQQLQQEVERLRRDLAAQAGMTTQLRSKLNLAEHERQQLQQRVQHQHYPTNSITQHKTQELEKQVQSMQTKLMFAEQELSEAKKKATDKESKAADVETRFKQLQDELRNKEEQMLQLQHELEQEKQRVERLSVNPAAAAAAAAVSGSAVGSYSRQSGGGGLGLTTPGSSGGRKRRLNPANPAAAAAGATQSPFAGGVGPNASQQQQMTPLQQHHMQMQQLLQGRPSASKPQQQQQQQQFMDVPINDNASAVDADVQQQLMQVDQAMPLQRQETAIALAQQQQQPLQQQQPAEEPPAGLIRLIHRVQVVQVTDSSLSSLLWSTCKPALQQLLQPLQAQLPSLYSSSSASSVAAGEAAQEAAARRLLSLLASVQQQLQAVAGNSSSSSNATGLLLSLMQLAAVMFPAGGLGVGDGNNPGATQAVSSRWLLQPPESHTGNSSSMVDSTQPQPPPQQQQQQYLVYQAVDNTQVVHILPLPLAVAVLQLLQGLTLLDSSCLAIMAAAVGASQVLGSDVLLISSVRYGFRSDKLAGASTPFAGSRHAATTAAADAAAPAAGSSRNQEVGLLQRGWSYSKRSGSSAQSSSAAAAVSCWASAEAAAESVLHLQHGSSSNGTSMPSGSRKRGQESADAVAVEQKRTLFGLLADACMSHQSLQLRVGSVLAALAGRLPATLQHLLLPAAADSNLLVQLLHAEGYQQRCQAAAVLLEMLVSSVVAAALAAAIGSTAADQATADGGDRDLGQGPVPAPLQPCNRNISYTQRSSRAAAKAAVAAAFQEKPQQQQQNGPAGTPGFLQPCNVPSQAVYDLLFGLLECISCGIGDLPRHPESGSSSNGVAGIYDSSSRGWGVFELQRRACAAVAEMLQTRQEALLQVMLDGYFTSGFGLSQRLLALADAAISAEGGDPFCTATPLPPRPTAAAAAAGRVSATAPLAAAALPGNGDVTQSTRGVSNITGSKCEWWECLERVRLAHESLLLLRALMATMEPVGLAATADICSNMTSIRMVQTTRAKLSEWSDAVLAAAAAGAAQGADMPTSHHTIAAAAAAPTAAAGLPLAPWAWKYSSSCGCRDKHSSNSTVRVGRSSGLNLSNVSEQLLRSQRPLLQDCLQEISGAATSVHRRAIQYLS